MSTFEIILFLLSFYLEFVKRTLELEYMKDIF